MPILPTVFDLPFQINLEKITKSSLSANLYKNCKHLQILQININILLLQNYKRCYKKTEINKLVLLSCSMNVKNISLWINSIIVSLHVHVHAHAQISLLYRFRCCMTVTLSIYLISIMSQHLFADIMVTLISVLRYIHVIGDIDITGRQSLTAE